MATATTTPGKLSLTEYLGDSGEWEPDVDYVDGEIEERHMGERSHAKWQDAIQYWFRLNEKQWRLFGYPELRVQTLPTHFRVPDVLLLDENAPDEEIITHPPIAVFEVLSSEDRVQRLRRKLAEFAAMGVGEIWVVDPETAVWTRFEYGQLIAHSRFALPGYGVEFDMAEIGKLVR